MTFAERIIKLFNLNYRESWAVNQIVSQFRSLSPKRFIAGTLAIFELFGMLFFDNATTPRGEALNLDGYSLVFCDDFDGESLDTSAWYYRGNGVRRGGFMAPSQISVKNGNCVITGEYLENGAFGAGWYTGMIALTQKYTYGYFETRCICNNSDEIWSAFWIQADAPYTPEISRGGVGGAELDIFESLSYGDKKNHNSVSHNIHCAGMKGDTSGEINSCALGRFKGNNIYTEYNTYGLKWTPQEYIFYINGVETTRSSFADGVSAVPESVLLSMCPPEEITLDKSTKTEFIIDYVKIWQTN